MVVCVCVVVCGCRYVVDGTLVCSCMVIYVRLFVCKRMSVSL